MKKATATKAARKTAPRKAIAGKQAIINITRAQIMNLRQLKGELDELNARIEAVRAAELQDAIDTCRSIIDLYGLTAHDLGLVKTQHIPSAKRVTKTFKPKAKRGPQPPLYRDPESGATWSGRGRAPHWLGEDRDEFLIARAA